MSDDSSLAPQNRDELLDLIAAAIRLQLTYISHDQAKAIADTICLQPERPGTAH